jgi:hypothetical protein
MPAGSGKKGPQGASDEIGRHKDRVYPLGGKICTRTRTYK